MSEDRDRNSDTTIEYPLEDKEMGEQVGEEQAPCPERSWLQRKTRGEGGGKIRGAPDLKRKPQGVDPLEVGKVLQVAAEAETSQPIYIYTFYIAVLLQIYMCITETATYEVEHLTRHLKLTSCQYLLNI